MKAKAHGHQGVTINFTSDFQKCTCCLRIVACMSEIATDDQRNVLQDRRPTSKQSLAQQLANTTNMYCQCGSQISQIYSFVPGCQNPKYVFVCNDCRSKELWDHNTHTIADSLLDYNFESLLDMMLQRSGTQGRQSGVKRKRGSRPEIKSATMARSISDGFQSPGLNQSGK
jgi:hypothetical protein